MRQLFRLGLLTTAVLAGHAWAADPPPIYVDQGPNWTDGTRKDFYTRDQGARMIPLPWLKALKQPNGQPFLADSLARYGYLPNPDNRNGLPVGFTASGPAGAQIAGMTCSACHTRQITAEGKTYRIDGGPAIVDFQSYLADLDAAVGRALSSDAEFQSFAAAVFSPAPPDPVDVLALRVRVDAWYLPFHTLVSRALPNPPWGPARLDAVGMIFNRLTGLDIGTSPDRLIPDNIKRADAPVRYPFLWNAPRQDKTQWPGFADNGNDILALARNLGQVYGVFGVFEPTKNSVLGVEYIDYLHNNSANFDSLGAIEGWIKDIGPPKWPREWLLDTNLAAQGKPIYEANCGGCHGIKPGTVRFFEVQTWSTPVQDVGTDTREYDILAWTAKTGVLQGAYIPFVTQPLQETDLAFSILGTSVLGSIAEHYLTGGGFAMAAAPQATRVFSSQAAPTSAAPAQVTRLPPQLRDLEHAFNTPVPQPPRMDIEGMRASGVPAPRTAAAAPPPRGAYESRVLQGIWATAPYLHNGSVPTLAELLKPAAQRVKSFKIGSAYDTVNIGLAVEQTQFNYILTTTDCSDRNSGNSNCGHEYGTTLSDQDKKALLEYLKTL